MGLGGTVDLSERTRDKGENNLECCSKSYNGWMMDDGRTLPANGTENAVFNFPRNATQNKTRKIIFPTHQRFPDLKQIYPSKEEMKWCHRQPRLRVLCTLQPHKGK